MSNVHVFTEVQPSYCNVTPLSRKSETENRMNKGRVFTEVQPSHFNMTALFGLRSFMLFRSPKRYVAQIWFRVAILTFVESQHSCDCAVFLSMHEHRFVLHNVFRLLSLTLM